MSVSVPHRKKELGAPKIVASVVLTSQHDIPTAFAPIARGPNQFGTASRFRASRQLLLERQPLHTSLTKIDP